MNYMQRLAALRAEMKKENIAAYMLTSDDEFLASQGCIHDRGKVIRWLTGFTGEAGLVIVTGEEIGLWTDSRFTVQAQKQVKLKGFTLYNTNEVSMSHYLAYLCRFFAQRQERKPRFGVDGRTISTDQGRTLAERFAEVEGKEIELCSIDLIERVWKDRPAPGFRPIFEIPERYAGRSRVEKAKDVRAAMEQVGASYYIVGGLEGTPWLTNLRGHESASPLFGAHALITPEHVRIFCKTDMIPTDVQCHVLADGFDLIDIDGAESEIRSIPAGAAVFFDENLTNFNLRKAIPDSCKAITGIDLINRIKAVKNPTEIEGFRKANLLDSVALFRMYRDVKQGIKERPYTERECYHILEHYREMDPEYFKGSSAVLSCAYNENAAMQHYNPTEEDNSVMYPSGNMVVDAQAHSFWGTTDTCRVIYLGPSEYDAQMRRDYTLVLKSLIATCSQRLRKGQAGVFLDSIARSVLAQGRAFYGHGTGHGIGYISSPHEGPIALSQPAYKRAWAFEWMPLQAGNIISIEPGIYREGQYGIRLENNLVMVEDGKNEFGEWLRLETLFYHPFERDLIEVSALTDSELEWLNAYHAATYEKLSGYLEEEELPYLQMLTAPMSR